MEWWTSWLIGAAQPRSRRAEAWARRMLTHALLPGQQALRKPEQEMASRLHQEPDRISVAPAPLNRLTGARYHDLPGTLEVMARLYEASAVDGFEFQNLAEWDGRTPPRDEAERRLAAWTSSEKYNVKQIAGLLREAGLPILSVHANRDIGICLCSDRPEEVQRGRTLVHESLGLAEEVGAGVCVLHLWDTWKEEFDPSFLREVLGEIAASYPGVKPAVENVPTQLSGFSPSDLVQNLSWITLDLRWAALYDELDRFGAIVDGMVNVHLSGQLADSEWTTSPAWFPSQRKTFGFYQALDRIRGEWGRAGLWTVEYYGQPGDTWENLLAAMVSLRGRFGQPLP